MCIRDSPRPALHLALDQAGRLLTTTDRTHAANPTPCTDYDVARLIDHLQAVVRRIGTVADGGHFSEVPREWPPTDNWTTTWDEGRARTDQALAAADLDMSVAAPWGEATLRTAAAMYVSELATHAWDLAVATGRRDELDGAVAEIALPIARNGVPAERGEHVPFADVVPVPDDAPAYDRLAAWCGRDPGWEN
ncbi:TIGR03086 family metal-binding protein, partial [Myceligenerans indicum]